LTQNWELIDFGLSAKFDADPNVKVPEGSVTLQPGARSEKAGPTARVLNTREQSATYRWTIKDDVEMAMQLFQANADAFISLTEKTKTTR
jgi:hypothetical protein